MTARSAIQKPHDKRAEGDAYYTPDDVARKLVGLMDELADEEPRYVLEPSVGGGAFARAARERWPLALVSGCDSDPKATGFRDVNPSVIGDFPSLVRNRTILGHDVVIGNPPYAKGIEHVEAGLSVLNPKGVLGFLLRLAILEGQGRQPFWKAHPPLSVHVLVRRPSFSGPHEAGKTDSAAYAFIRWSKVPTGRMPVLGWVGA